MIYKLIEPRILFPAIATVLSLILWGATLALIKAERRIAHDNAQVSASELSETYHAQVVRALNQIDQVLRLIQHDFAQTSGKTSLDTLSASQLLPPALLFEVRLFDVKGHLITSNQQDELTAYMYQNAGSGPVAGILISPPIFNHETGAWSLIFSRSLFKGDGSLSGSVEIEVDSSFFVSGYDDKKLGKQGMVGVIGLEHEFKAMRIGDHITAGDRLPGDFWDAAHSLGAEKSVLLDSPWDGIRRYFGTQRLYDYPLIIMIGLSELEQLQDVRRHANNFRIWAAISNFVLLLVIGLIWRMRYKLDTSRQREMEARIDHLKQIEHMAFHDALTGLPNRSLFSKLLAQNIKEAERYQHSLSVLFLDLDRFKLINDTLGHDAGDALLIEVANRLSGCLRESDTVARLGGDEFVVVLPNVEESGYTELVARKMISAVAKPYMLCGSEFRVTVSIGVSTYPEGGLDEQQLTKNADAAMYQAKEGGKNNFRIYSAEQHAESLQRLTLESSLQHALENDEFLLHYQMKRDAHTGDITGMEALLRWQHPDLGLVPPMQFIPLTEETGLIIPIGQWVIRKVCEQNMEWK